MNLKLHRQAAALTIAALFAGPQPLTAADAMRDVVLTTGYAEVFAYETAPVAVILGDDAVAAANVTVADVLVLTAQGSGATNVIVLAEGGREIDRFNLIVRDAGGAVAERRGVARRLLRCDPRCRPTEEADAQPLPEQKTAQAVVADAVREN